MTEFSWSLWRYAASGSRASISRCNFSDRKRSHPIGELLVRGKHSQGKSKQNSPSSNKWLERQRKDPYVAMAHDKGLPSRSSFKLQEINEFHFPNLLAKLEKKSKGNGSNRPNRRTLIQPGALILDLGAAPGGWSLYASTELRVDLGGAVVAVDLLSLEETLHSGYSDISSRIRANLQSNFHFIQGDFTMNQTREWIMDAFASVSNNTQNNDNTGDESYAIGRRPNLVLSDMAANFTGDSDTDAIRTLDLCERALAFAAGTGCFDPSYSAKDGQGVLEEGGVFLCKFFSYGKENEADLMDASRRAFRSVHVLKPKASRKESSEMYLLALDHRK
jgi:23S rRNA (uridine2552-2'-O)-methyltransferase